MNETYMQQKLLEIAKKSLENPKFAQKLRKNFKQTMQEEGIDCASFTVKYELMLNDNKTFNFVLPFQNDDELSNEELSKLVAAKTNNPGSLGTFPSTLSTSDVAHLNKTHYYSCKGPNAYDDPAPS